MRYAVYYTCTGFCGVNSNAYLAYTMSCIGHEEVRHQVTDPGEMECLVGLNGRIDAGPNQSVLRGGTRTP